MATDLFNLAGRTAIVTGASRGLGLAMAAGLADAGADVIGISRSLGADDGDVGRAVRAQGRHFEGIVADFARREDTIHVAGELADRRPDILVLNHGITMRFPAADYPLDAWDEILEVNLTSHWILAKTIGEQMVNRGTGKIIFTASMLSYQGGNLVSGYAATKHGLAGVAKSLSNEWAPHGVQVNAIAPGYIDTDMNTPLLSDATRAPKFLERIPEGRWGQPSDMIGAVVFLASPASDYMTGALLPVDGGWLAK